MELAPDARRLSVRDVGCGDDEVRPLTPLAPSSGEDGEPQQRELEFSTINDISVVRGRKKKGKYKTNVVVVGGFDEVPLDSAKFNSSLDSFVNGGRGVKVDWAGDRFESSSVEICSGSMYQPLSLDEPEGSSFENVLDSEVETGEESPPSPPPTEPVAHPDSLPQDEDAGLPDDSISSCDFAAKGCISSSLETDAFEGDIETCLSLDDRPSVHAPVKRNRQVSTDSCGSAAAEIRSNRKANKKTKKKDRPKTGELDDIDRILAELAVDEPSAVRSGASCEVKQKAPPASAPVDVPDKRKKKKKKPKTSIKMPVSDSDILPSDGQSPEIRESTLPLPKTVDSQQENGNSGPTCDTTESDAKPTVKRDCKKDRKKPSKKQLEAIHEALRKAREEEEKHLQEERARQKKLEEAERLRQELLRREQERKDRKKQKAKDKRERLRAEGKLLTKSQKMARAKVEAALLAWKQHGVDVPQVGGKRSVAESRISSKTEVPCKMESDVEPISLMSTSSFSTDTEEQSCWEPSAVSDDGVCVLANGYSSRKQRHLSDPAADVGRGIPQHQPSEHHPVQVAGFGVGARLRAKSAGDLHLKAERNGRPSSSEPGESSQDSLVTTLRSPVVCVLGHVDTGKTKILDKIRKTHVQDGEAGGITQQIGATMIPNRAIREKCHMVKSFAEFELMLPGFLVIDTPGHESFRNLRSRGSSLCDMAILVVDIMHGLEQQTLESIELLKQRKTPFVVALNKVDRLYGWQCCGDDDIEDVIKRQGITTMMEFDKKYKHIIAELAVQELNAALFYDNPDPRTYISMVPVSAITGDGMGNLLASVSQLCQTMMSKRLTFSEELQATVLEVKTIPGLGTTIDVILVNGYLRESDTIVVAGQDGPIVTQIRSILMPQPLRELRVKNPYQEFKTVKGAQGVKLCAKDLDKAVAGLPLFVASRPEQVPDLKERVTRLFRSTINSIKVSERGVYVQASTLGSLEALLEFLKNSGVSYAGVKVGPVVKKDVMKASVMLEHDVQFAVILAFDVKVERDAQELADHLGIKIFQADIIYHLFDSFIEHREKLAEKKKNDLKKFFVLPCKLSVLPDFVVSVRDPVVVGVRVIAGILKVGTPLCVPSKNFLDLGVVGSIQVDNRSVECAKEGDEVCVKIESCSDQSSKTYGKHFDHTDLIVSKISRQTIDVCKEYYRDDLRKSDWQLMVELKKLFLIV